MLGLSLAGAAAAGAGVTQQMMGVLGGYAVGLVTHDDATHLRLVMLGFAGIGAVAQAVLFRRRRG
jgi:DHA1 family bicyclomycin/chloramphenicol resistance-like MFS transporter